MKLDSKEFVRLYDSVRIEHPEKAMVDCYEFSEVLHESIFGCRKYSDYNSFQTTVNKKK